MLVRTADLPFPRATTTNYYRVLLLLELVPADEMMVQTGSRQNNQLAYCHVSSSDGQTGANGPEERRR